MGNFLDKPVNDIFEIISPDKILFYKTDEQSVNGFKYIFLKPNKNVTIENYVRDLSTTCKINKEIINFNLKFDNIKEVITPNGRMLEITTTNNGIRNTIRLNNKLKIIEAVCEIPIRFYSMEPDSVY